MDDLAINWDGESAVCSKVYFYCLKGQCPVTLKELDIYLFLFIYLFENPSIIRNEKDGVRTYKYKKIYKNISEET